MTRLHRVVAAPLLVLVAVAGACGEGDETAGGGDEPLRVAFVYVGPVGDAGWTKRHDDGRLAVEDELGDAVETTFVESVPEGAESVRVFEDLVRQGYDLIFGASFGYGGPMLEVASRHPDVCFQHATGSRTAENLGTYFGAAEEGRYLAGMAAGAATGGGRIGYVAAFPIPEVLRGINAFALGARSVRADATVQVVWTSTWFGPEEEKQAAESLLSAGADVLTMHQDTPATGEAAADAGAAWAGYNDDMSRFAPAAWLTAPVWDWGPFYVRTAQAVLDGDCPNDQYYGDMADGLVGLAPFGDSVDEATREAIEARREEIVAGTFEVFTGPVVDQGGRVRVPEGSTATLEELLATDYLVEGVIGEIPESG